MGEWSLLEDAAPKFTPDAKPPLESEFQKDVLKRLRLIPSSWWQKLNDRTTVGLPDIIGSVVGYFVGIELKTRSKVTPIQAYTLRKIGNTGAYVFVVTPQNWSKVYAFLLELSETPPKSASE